MGKKTSSRRYSNPLAEDSVINYISVGLMVVAFIFGIIKFW